MKTIKTIELEIPTLDLNILNEVVGKDEDSFKNMEENSLYSKNIYIENFKSNWKYKTEIFKIEDEEFFIIVELVSEDFYSQAILYRVKNEIAIEESFTDPEYESFSGEYFIEYNNRQIILDVI